MVAPEVNTVIVKLASRCNLNCEYCYLYQHADQSYRNRPKFMSADVFDGAIRIADEAASANSSNAVSLVMHGGEPTLLPLPMFRSYVDQARDRLGPKLRRISLQTNGTVITDAWMDALIDGSVGVGVSIDGPAHIHDAVRKGHDGRGSWSRVAASIRRLQDRGLDVGTLTVITPGADGLEVFEHLLSLDVRRMSFLLPDVSHDDFARWYGHYGVTPVADYLIPIFDSWFEKDDPGVVIAICWDIVERLMGGPGMTDTFGNRQLKYIVVETDGTVEALDALKVGKDGLADTGLNVLRDRLSDFSRQDTLAARALTSGFGLPTQCSGCRFASVCGGGYLPHRYASRNGFDNPSVWCRDLKKVFDHASEAIKTRQGDN
ncbi:radical SAM protein [Streptomyces sp. M2CJ-2]|uniref:radical SAM protein n=1 Tax=Streptomyces sp. M2CJ-2 TaxID=2803948 RepID=UPI001925FC6D|nr:radical SAM protein [Streptomyces sp. M2CJ-2]MBL3670873.1 radical SAM protein [Streptomyces sp. M2CJ-2]